MSAIYSGWARTECRGCQGTGQSFDPTSQDAVITDPRAGRCSTCEGRGFRLTGVLRPELAEADARETAAVRAVYSGSDEIDLPDWML